MKIVIEMSERAYEAIKEHGMRDIWGIGEAIADGTPLPKGHGDLIDRSLLLEDMERGYRFANELVALGFAESFIEHAQTIIEADEKGEEE